MPTEANAVIEYSPGNAHDYTRRTSSERLPHIGYRNA